MNYIRVLTKSGDDTIDLFHGFGGWSIAAQVAGLFVKWALNHDEHKVKVHSENFPKTIHHQADVHHTDPKQHPRTRVFLGSPCCDDFSQAKTHKTKLEHEAQMRLFSEDEKEREKAIAERQKRATMWNVWDFARTHQYQIGAIENVVDVHRWGGFSEWVREMKNLDYEYKMLYFNSMFFHELNGVTGLPAAPQSRDRWYCVFWKKGTPAPDLDFSPLAPCPNCGNVRAVQVWKNPKRQYGKYGIKGGSYYYGCPNCLEKYSTKGWKPVSKNQYQLPGLDPDTGNYTVADGVRPLPVHPYYYAGINAIDFSIPIQRIGDFEKPISPNTRARVAVGLERFGSDPFLMNGNWWKYKSALLSPSFTQTTNRHLWVVIPPFILKESHGSDDVRSSLDELYTQTGSRSLAFVLPNSLISVLDPGDEPENRARSILDVFPTQTGWKNHQAVSALPVLIDLAHSSKHNEDERRVWSGADTWPTQTTADTLGVFWPAWIVELYGNGTIRSTFDPANTATAGGGKHGLAIPPFVATYNGNPVYARMEDELPTATTNERHGLAIPENLSVDDCYYRTLRSIYKTKGSNGISILKSEIGRVMGFPDWFRFFGTTDEVTEGFGGAVTPGKGSWIVDRIRRVLD